MTRLTFMRVRDLLKQHFHPLGCEAVLESPNSLLVRVYDSTNDETLLTVTGIACSSSFSDAEVQRLIGTIESDLELVQSQGKRTRDK
ncbi:DUF1652 domain-containing protein [Stutzerimonas azotifigens]|uniref:DUF1652 domain-containing protein n=1 Tax=Stutzerimonas azotifigens TaxID=291995 RepID=UPI000425C00C|nr:DUF1652 domain-containing protein [Stutzerimonas azotifigens]